MNKNSERRPLKVRELNIMGIIARKLSQSNITPNQISLMSVLFAFFAALCLLALPVWQNFWLSWLAALFIQCRLLCNLFDGMVAMEGGKSTQSGELFNDIPDRVADPLILVAAGYAIAALPFGIELGWLAGLLAVKTAYIRVLAHSIGAPALFTGPMAKQHRMAIMTFALFLLPLEVLWFGTLGYCVWVALLVICLGCCLTLYRRSRDAYVYLETTPNKENKDV